MPPRRKKSQEVSDPADLLALMSKHLLQQARKPNMIGYQPHAKQSAFHRQECFARLYIGGNRSGKTYGCVAEDIWWASGTHPYKNIKEMWPGEQIRGRVVAVDFDRGVHQIILPLFKILCPMSYLRGDSWEAAWERVGNGGILHFKYNDSYIEFLSYEQSIEKFAGTSRHFIHFDEEPPEGIYNECNARLVDTGGCSWISMTPVDGMTWLYDKLYGPADESSSKVIDLEGVEYVGPIWRSPEHYLGVVEVGMNENPHLSPEARERYLATLDEDERAARSKGKFVQTAGKVFKNFSAETHVTSEDFNPKMLESQGWQIYSSVDHGWNSPTAWLWHAVSPLNEVITFAEHFKSELTIEEHSAVVKAKEAEWGIDVSNIIRTGDPAMHQHTAVTGTTMIQEYARHGIYIYTDSVPKNPDIGIDRMQAYFKLRNGKPAWVISDTCVNFIRELKNLRWKSYTSKKLRDQNNPQERVHKLNDHAFDSAKYFATFLFDLAPEPLPETVPGRSATLSYDEALSRSLARAVNDGPQWTIVETYS